MEPTESLIANSTAEIEREFIASALSRVNSPVLRYWLTMCFDALATAFAELEAGAGLPGDDGDSQMNT